MVVGLSYLVIYFYDFDLEYARCSVVTEKGQTFHMIQGVRTSSELPCDKAVTIPGGSDSNPVLLNDNILSAAYCK